MKTEEELRKWIKEIKDDFFKEEFSSISYRTIYKSRYNDRIWVIKTILEDLEIYGDEDYIGTNE